MEGETEMERGSEEEKQIKMWEEMEKAIRRSVKEVNELNISHVASKLLFSEEINLMRGRGKFCSALFYSQKLNPNLTPVYAALIAVVNSVFPEIGKLVLSRMICKIGVAYDEKDKGELINLSRFLTHLVNQRVASPALAFDLIERLLSGYASDNPSSDMGRVVLEFVKECGYTLDREGLREVFNCFRDTLLRGRGTANANQTSPPVDLLLEGMFAVRGAELDDAAAVPLLVVPTKDQVTHFDLNSLSLLVDSEDSLDHFTFDPDFLDNEQRHRELVNSFVGEGRPGKFEVIKPRSPTKPTTLRRTICSTVLSFLYDNADAYISALSLLKTAEGHDRLMCSVILECCGQERTYQPFFGHLARALCHIHKPYQHLLEESLTQACSMLHSSPINVVRNLSKFFAYLVSSYALDWVVVLRSFPLGEESGSSYRIFVKCFFVYLAELLGMDVLKERLKGPELQDCLRSLFGKDSLANVHYSINFFTFISLGPITDDMRAYLKERETKKGQKKRKREAVEVEA